MGPAVDELYAEKWRFDTGMGYVFGQEWAGEFHFIVQRSRPGPDQIFETDDFIFRLVVKRLWSTRDFMSQES